jgi:hypothetical protein
MQRSCCSRRLDRWFLAGPSLVGSHHAGSGVCIASRWRGFVLQTVTGWMQVGWQRRAVLAGRVLQLSERHQLDAIADRDRFKRSKHVRWRVAVIAKRNYARILCAHPCGVNLKVPPGGDSPDHHVARLPDRRVKPPFPWATPRIQPAPTGRVRRLVCGRWLEYALPLKPGPLEAKTVRRTAVAPRHIDTRLPRPASRPQRPKLPEGIGLPLAIPNHTLGEHRHVLPRRRRRHLSAGSSSERRGPAGTGSAGCFSRSGPRAGAGSSSGSTITGIDSPGRPIRDSKILGGRGLTPWGEEQLRPLTLGSGLFTAGFAGRAEAACG